MLPLFQLSLSELLKEVLHNVQSAVESFLPKLYRLIAVSHEQVIGIFQ